MVDEVFDRAYQAGRADLNAGIKMVAGRFAHAINNAFEVLVRIEYNSPWSAKPKRARCN